ncbi:hypothetical protein MHYP_G00232730 [Metynnis hypsauchen]
MGGVLGYSGTLDKLVFCCASLHSTPKRIIRPGRFVGESNTTMMHCASSLQQPLRRIRARSRLDCGGVKRGADALRLHPAAASRAQGGWRSCQLFPSPYRLARFRS